MGFEPTIPVGERPQTHAIVLRNILCLIHSLIGCPDDGSAGVSETSLRVFRVHDVKSLRLLYQRSLLAIRLQHDYESTRRDKALAHRRRSTHTTCIASV